MSADLDRSRPLFAYGTLMFPEVISRLLGRTPPGATAKIGGYKNCGVRGQSFPGLLYTGEGTVTGVLYPKLTVEDWEKLDAFEDDFYRLQEVEIETEGGLRPALAYIVPPENAGVLTDESWDREAFRRDFLTQYIRRTVEGAL